MSALEIRNPQFRLSVYWLRPVSRCRHVESSARRSGRAALRRSVTRDDRAQRLRHSLLQQSLPLRQTPPYLLGASRQLQNLRRKRFRGAFSIDHSCRAHRIVDLHLGLTHGGKSRRLVGGDRIHALAPNFRSCESRGRRHVAGVVRDNCALERIRTATRLPNE